MCKMQKKVVQFDLSLCELTSWVHLGAELQTVQGCSQVSVTCHSVDSGSVLALLASSQPDGLVLPDHRGLDGLQHGHLLPGDVGP